MRIRPLIAPLLLALAMGSVLSACGSERQSTKAPTWAELKAGLAGSPPALAAIHGQMGKVLTDGRQSFERTLSGLKGYPVVVNAWASWCGPCRYEFPVLGQASLKLGREVAFLGIASRDQTASARSFLERNPVGYPSWADADGRISQSVGVGVGLPATVFYDRSGRRAYIHQGPYDSVAALDADIQRYANGP